MTIDRKIQLSIIVPVYNVEHYVDKCLQSIIKQYNDNLEIILINDGSTDDSVRKCEKYCEQYEYIHLFNQKNGGLSSARNQGIRQSRGEYLFFLDSDDYMKENVIAELLHIISKTNKDIILGKKDLYIEKTGEHIVSVVDYAKYEKEEESFKIYEDLIINEPFYFTASMLAVKRDFLHENKLYFKEGIYHEDELWIMHIFLCARSVEFFDKSIYCYRVGREGSIIQTRNIKREFDKLRIIDEYEKIEKEVSDKRKKNILKERKAFLEWIVIQEINYYKADPQINELKDWLSKRIYHLAYGKYILRFLGCKLFGVQLMCDVNLKLSYVYNFLKTYKTKKYTNNR